MNVAAAAQLACLLEVSAPKPGNVAPGRDFADARYEHFLASAIAIGEPMAAARGRPLGLTVRVAVNATARVAPSNTNLGIVLLLAPIASAPAPTRDGVRRVLRATTVDDAREVYAAIRLANPGGLGAVEAQDVRREPTAPLADVMALAAARDGVAREYATAFETTFTRALPALLRGLADGLSWPDAIVETYLTLLAASADTHIARRGGLSRAAEVMREAAAVLAEGGVRTVAGRRRVEAFDTALRDPRNISNPGTTADLTAAAIFVALLDGAWEAGHGGSHAGTR